MQMRTVVPNVSKRMSKSIVLVVLITAVAVILWNGFDSTHGRGDDLRSTYLSKKNFESISNSEHGKNIEEGPHKMDGKSDNPSCLKRLLATISKASATKPASFLEVIPFDKDAFVRGDADGEPKSVFDVSGETLAKIDGVLFLKDKKQKAPAWSQESKMLVFGDNELGLAVNLDKCAISSIKISDEVTTKMPGSTLLGKSYNLLRGAYFESTYAKRIGVFTIPSTGTEHALEGDTYRIPSMVDLVVSPRCSSSQKWKEISKTWSTSLMTHKSEGQFSGYDSTTTVDAAVSAGPASVGASRDIRTALLFGNSDSMMQSQQRAAEDYSYEAVIEKNSMSFEAQIRWEDSVSTNYFTFDSGFLSAVKTLGSSTFLTNKDRNKKVMEFFDSRGSHVIKKAAMGAYCSQTTYMKAGYSASSSEKTEKTTENNEGEIFGFKWGSNEQLITSNKFDKSTGVTYGMQRLDCSGSVKSNMCGGSTSSYLHPSVLNAVSKPIWDLPVDVFGDASTKTKFGDACKKTLNELVTVAKSCADTYCGGKGVCVLKRTFWSQLSSFSGVFDSSDFLGKCVCRTGAYPKCAENPDPCDGCPPLSVISHVAWSGVSGVARMATRDGFTGLMYAIDPFGIIYVAETDFGQDVSWNAVHVHIHLHDISVAKGMVVGRSTQQTMWKLVKDGTYSGFFTVEAVKQGKWAPIPGMKVLALAVCGSASLWCVGVDNQIYFSKTIDAVQWELVSGAPSTYISCDPITDVPVVISGGGVHVRTGVTSQNLKGTGWVSAGGSLTKVSSCDGNLLGVQGSGQIWVKPKVGGSWYEIGGRLNQVSLSEGGLAIGAVLGHILAARLKL